MYLRNNPQPKSERRTRRGPLDIVLPGRTRCRQRRTGTTLHGLQGRLLTVIYDFEVHADMDPVSFERNILQEYNQDQFETLLISSKVSTKILDISGDLLDAQDDPVTIFKKYSNFPANLSTTPIVVKYSLTNYELLPSFP